jgi:hypothetical protein
MKLIHPKKILYLSKLTCMDCVDLIFSFAFKLIEVQHRELIHRIQLILNHGFSRTCVDELFYYIWDDADNDCFWSHQYIDGKRVTLSNVNCVKCGNYEPSISNLVNKTILCSCPLFFEFHTDLS